jgi:hypothetical protein
MYKVITRVPGGFMEERYVTFEQANRAKFYAHKWFQLDSVITRIDKGLFND